MPISLRLSEETEAALDAEAETEGISRSEVVREAIAEYLDRKRRDRFMGELTREMREAYGDPETRAEALDLAGAGADDGLRKIVEDEVEAGIDPDARWWR